MLFLLYPPRCPICERLRDIRDPGICVSCRKKIAYASEPRCKKCGKKLKTESAEYCEDCRVYPHEFTQARAAWLYQDPVRGAVYRFKNSNRREYASVFAEEMIRQNAVWLSNLKVDFIVAVPLHKKKRRLRGYNQAELLATEISRKCGIPLRRDLLYKSKETEQQKSLTRQKRKANLKDAFLVKEKIPSGQSFLLIDDVYTTGSTADAAALVLKEAGAKAVYVLCLCIGNS
jgi:ComF family protein